MADGWFFESDGEQQGPIPAVKLRQMAVDGSLSRDTKVMKEGWPDWVAAEKVKGLFTEARTPAPEPPKPKPAPAAPVDDSPFSNLAEPSSPPRGASKRQDDDDEESDYDPPPKPQKSSPSSKTNLQRPKVGKTPSNPFVELPEPPPPPTPRPAPAPPAPVVPQAPVASVQPPPIVAPTPPITVVQNVKLLTHGGQTIHISLPDLAALIRAGEISDSAMIAVETWLPVGTLKTMLSLSSAASPVVPQESKAVSWQEEQARAAFDLDNLKGPANKAPVAFESLETDPSIPFRPVITDDEPVGEVDLDFWTEPEEKR